MACRKGTNNKCFVRDWTQIGARDHAPREAATNLAHPLSKAEKGVTDVNRARTKNPDGSTGLAGVGSVAGAATAEDIENPRRERGATAGVGPFMFREQCGRDWSPSR